jgi:hypothetical protein
MVLAWRVSPETPSPYPRYHHWAMDPFVARRGCVGFVSSLLIALHHPDSRQHRRAITLRNEQQRFHRGSPFRCIVLGFGQRHGIA